MKLVDFLIYLGQHPHKVVQAKQDPHAVMEEVGLSQDDQALLMSGDMSRLGQAIERQTPVNPIGS